MARRSLIPLAAALATLALAASASAQQLPDSAFDVSVAHPAHVGRAPRVLFDEAHHNFHTSTGRYLPFARLITHDGCRVTPGTQPFSAATLRGFDLLVISNALGHEDMGDPAAADAAFTPEECDAVRDWVRAGGALLLIADHAPMGGAARALGERFGVDMRAAYTVDPDLGEPDNPSLVTYEPGRGLDASHPIVAGRDSSERVRRVVTFTGQSLAGPPGAVSLLTLGARAEDLMVGLGQAGPGVPKEKRKSAAGRSQALAFEFGKGRVVVLAEAAMMTAQVAGPQRVPMGMNRPGNDDRRFALNLERWLTRALR